METVFMKDELWWGGAAHHGIKMPICRNSNYEIDLYTCSAGNQSVPFFLSSKGRTIWCETPYRISFKNGNIKAESRTDEVVLAYEGKTLSGAYRYAEKAYFPVVKTLPDPRYFLTPQYNTWAELNYSQTQESVLSYARSLLKNGYKPGILIIDDGWQTDYGVWEFNPLTYPSPKKMVGALHEMGFTVMVWICPYISADCIIFRNAMRDSKRLMRNADGTPAILQWSNGYSGVLNMSSETDRADLRARLDAFMNQTGVDGFKFDKGSIESYPQSLEVSMGITAVEMTQSWNSFALSYRFHEVKDTWKAGGLPYIQRLRDKDHTWEGDGLACIIPDAIALSLTGHHYLCPDMIGGGELYYFIDDYPLDEELIVRFAQCSALFPMMQFSVAPWRILSEENNRRVRRMHDLHIEMGEEIYQIVTRSAATGEPVLRPLAYNYPGMERITDEFLLGEDILVAPVLEKGAVSREVVFPVGFWRDADGNEHSGHSKVPAPLDDLPWFRKKIG